MAKQVVTDARIELAGLKQLIRDMDMQAEKLTDDEGIITGYKFNTGAWHRLLGVLAGAELPAYIQQQHSAPHPATPPEGDACKWCGRSERDHQPYLHPYAPAVPSSGGAG